MFIFSKLSLHVSQPVFMTETRTVLGGVILLIIYEIFSYSWQKIRLITKLQSGLIAFFSFMNAYLCNGLEICGLQYLSVGKTPFIY